MKDEGEPEWALKARSLCWPEGRISLIMDSQKQLGSEIVFVHEDVILSQTATATFTSVKDHGTEGGLYRANIAAKEYLSQDFEIREAMEAADVTEEEWLEYEL